MNKKSINSPGFAGGIWSFAEVRFDEGARRLEVSGIEVSLEAKPLDVLAALLHHAGEVVTKEELADTVWNRPIINDAVVTKAVGKLRAALGPSARRAIKTVHGLGYQFVADVQLEPTASVRVSNFLGMQAGDQPYKRPGWRLIRCLDYGGYGEAWLVKERTTEQLRVFKFARERQGLSALKREVTLHRVLARTLGQHVGIQALLDWNLAEPAFFIESEYAAAGSLAEWARAGHLQSLDLTQRCELLARIADALAAAHSVGVLHKDLKPSNILMFNCGQGVPQPKLSDFGAGQVIAPDKLEELRITRLGFTRELDLSANPQLGAMLYAAPEVLAGNVATIRSDIYALGTILYQLAVADLDRPLAVGWQRELTCPLLIEDIEACVDGDPSRRLADAAQIAYRLRRRDERKQLREQQDLAHAQRKQLEQKLLRQKVRRRLHLALTLTITAGLVSSLWFYVKAQRSTFEAQEQTRIAETVNAFLISDIFANANPELTGQRDIPLQQLLETASASMNERFADQPKLEASLRNAIGDLFRALGEYDKADQQIERALKLLSSLDAGIEHTAATLLLRAQVFARLSRYDEARTLLQQLLSELPTDATDLRLQTRLQIAELNVDVRGRVARPEMLQVEEISREIRQHFGASSSITAAAEKMRANSLLAHERYGEALAARNLALDAYSQAYGPDHPALLRARIELQEILLQSRFNREPIVDEEALFTEILVRTQNAFGVSHNLSLQAAGNYGLWLIYDDQPEKAKEVLQEALQRQLSRFGETHALTLRIRNHLANALVGLGQYQAALDQYQHLAAWRKSQGLENTNYFETQYNRIVTLKRMQRDEECAALSQSMRARMTELGLEANNVFPASMIVEFDALWALGDIEQATEVLSQLEQWHATHYSPVPERLRARIKKRKEQVREVVSRG